jgi:hypothetical protein
VTSIGVEPITFGLENQRSIQLSYEIFIINLVTSIGVEPITFCFVGRCSFQLSYEILFLGIKKAPLLKVLWYYDIRYDYPICLYCCTCLLYPKSNLGATSSLCWSQLIIMLFSILSDCLYRKFVAFILCYIIIAIVIDFWYCYFSSAKILSKKTNFQIYF